MAVMRRVVCTTESNYSGALTRGSVYEVVAVDEAKRQLRVRNDRGRLRWYPQGCFGPPDQQVPRLARFHLDDRIEDPADEWVEVILGLENGMQRWCAFTTPVHLASYGERLTTVDGDEVVANWGGHMLVVSHLSTETIEAVLDYLDRQGELELHSIEIGPDIPSSASP